MDVRDDFPEHDRVLRHWFAANGWPVTETFDHADADIRAWRHSGPEWRCTLHVAKDVLDRNDAGRFARLLDERSTADALRELPKGEAILCYRGPLLVLRYFEDPES